MSTKIAVVVGVVAALLPVVALAQTWHVETMRDEFDGSRFSLVSQTGDDQQLTFDLVCNDAGTTVALMPGPAAGWSLFAHGDVDLRFDDGPTVSERFDDEDTVLVSHGLEIGRLAVADRLTVRVYPYGYGLEVDTFTMRGLAAAMERADCAAE